MEDQNFEEPPARVKHEPPVEFVLILPRPTIGWPLIKQEGENKSKRWVKSVEVKKFDAKWRDESEPFQTFLVCPHCQLVVKHQWVLTWHLKACIETNSNRFVCDHCGRKFQKKYLLRRHMLKHSRERRFRCTRCCLGFKAKQNLLKHSRSKKINKCAVCDIRFSCKLLLDRHRSDSHGNVFKCDKCSYQTKIEGLLKVHKGTHDKSYACETCRKKFSFNQSLKFHQMQHRHGIYATAPEETFDCDKCDKSFSTQCYLGQHQKTVHDKNEAKCEVCDKICKNRVSLLHHSQSHVKVECSICNRMVTKQLMAFHLRSKSGNRIYCDLCDHSTERKGDLKRHIEGKHLLRKLVNDSKCRDDFSEFKLLDKLQLKYGSSATTSEKKFKCDKCNKAFVVPSRLNQHKKIVHVDKLVECQICKKNVRQYKLKSHMKFHSPGNHFECDLCNYKSEIKKNLERHVKVRHRHGALICTNGCKEKFASFHHLVEHRKIHIGKNLWNCTECEFQTMHHSSLSYHMSTKKHKMSP